MFSSSYHVEGQMYCTHRNI